MDDDAMTDGELDSVRAFLTYGRDRLGKTDDEMWPVPRLVAEVDRLRARLADEEPGPATR